jgi:hypothetical protein
LSVEISLSAISKLVSRVLFVLMLYAIINQCRKRKQIFAFVSTILTIILHHGSGTLSDFDNFAFLWVVIFRY